MGGGSPSPEQPTVLPLSLCAVTYGTYKYLGVKMSDGSGRIIRFPIESIVELTLSDVDEDYYNLAFIPSPAPVITGDSDDDPITFDGLTRWDGEPYVDGYILYPQIGLDDDGNQIWKAEIYAGDILVSPDNWLITGDETPTIISDFSLLE